MNMDASSCVCSFDFPDLCSVIFNVQSLTSFVKFTHKYFILAEYFILEFGLESIKSETVIQIEVSSGLLDIRRET